LTAAAPRLLAISDRGSLPAGAGFEDWLRELAATFGAEDASSVLAVQLREKDLDDRALFDLARTCRGLLPPPLLLLVNGRIDVALAAGADGVHLPAAGLPLAPLRRLAAAGRRRFLLGRSTHRLEEVAAARDEGADYVTFGPVYPTPSKAAFGAPPGLGELRRAAGLGVPVLALGGVTAERLPELAAAGAHGAAAIRAFETAAGCRAMRAAATVFAATGGSGG
jgi:thiamine-phosphate pyrophosphorylase